MLIAAFDAGRIAARIAHLLPDGAEVVTLDAVRLPDALLTNRARYLDKLNFATNFVFFRDADGLSTRLVSANYWSGYGGGAIRLWLRLFDAAGDVLATWEQEVPAGPGGFSIDSRAVRERFGLPAFTGQLFLHAIGVAGHDVVKYALDTYARATTAPACRAPMTPMPGRRIAMPACRRRATDERVMLWLQNSHATPIPAGAVALDRMGAERPVALTQEVGPFATVAVDVGADAAGAALAGADRAARRAACGAAALRGDARRARAASRTSTSSAAICGRIPAIRGCRRSWGAAICCRSRCCRASGSAASCSRRRWR